MNMRLIKRIAWRLGCVPVFLVVFLFDLPFLMTAAMVALAVLVVHIFILTCESVMFQLPNGEWQYSIEYMRDNNKA